MSTYNIQFRDKIRQFPKIYFLSYRKNFVGLKKQFEIAMVNEPSVFELLRFDYFILFLPIYTEWTISLKEPGYSISYKIACAPRSVCVSDQADQSLRRAPYGLKGSQVPLGGERRR